MKNETTVTNRYSSTTCVKCFKTPTDHVYLLNSVGNKQIYTKSFTMLAIHRILIHVIVCTETTNKLIKNVTTQNLKSILIYTCIQQLKTEKR